MQMQFSGEVWEWRGPAPFHFVTVPEDEAAEIEAVAPMVSYGWGMVPASITIGDTCVTTSLWPKDGGYVVPLKDALRRPEHVSLGDVVTVRLTIDL